MKRVSFKVAKALKEAGYPQECDMYYSVPPKEQYIGLKVAQPTYLDTWLWLCENGSSISPICIHPNQWQVSTCNGEWKNPEEAIKEAINYLVENNLLK